MAIKQFAIPVDETSDESGDIPFKELVVANCFPSAPLAQEDQYYYGVV